MSVLFGSSNAGEDTSTAAIQALSDVKLPDIESMKLNLEQQVSQGIITPEEAQLYLQEASKMADINVDPSLYAAQKEALGGYQDIIANKGLDATAQAQLGQIATQEQTQSRGAREAILQNAQARGVGGSGIELASQMQAQQASAGQQAQRDMDVAANAQQRALQALQASGQLGGQMQSQQFSQQAQQAQAQDAINAFNTKNRQEVENLKVQNRNIAQATNLANAQSISDKNIDIRNKQQQFNKNLPQQQFQNEITRAGGVASGLQSRANLQAGNQRAENEGIDRLVGTGLTAGATAFAGAKAFASDENLKKDIKPFDSRAFLDELTGRNYKYKDEKFGKGPQSGIMAQDLEKVAPGAVINTDEGKMVDSNKLANVAMANLADINQRLKALEDLKKGKK